MQAGLLEVFEQDAALGLDDGLGQAGGAGGVQHPQRVVERDLLVVGFGLGRGRRVPVQGAFGGLGAEQRDVDGGAHRGQSGAQFGDSGGAVVGLAAVAVAVDREQHDRLDLLEAVQHAAGAEVGGAGGPYAADGRGGQERDDRVRGVGYVAADAVAGGDAEPAQFGGERGDLAAQFGPGDGGRFVPFVDVDEGGSVGLVEVEGGAQGVFGVVEPGAGEPARAGHRRIGEDRVGGGGEADVEPLGDRAPELLGRAHGPGVQGRVVGDGIGARGGGGTVPLGGPLLEAGQPGAGDPFGARAPQRLGAAGGGLGRGAHGRLPDGTRRCVGGSRTGVRRPGTGQDDAM